MNFIKLGKRYINLDAIAAVVPRQKGLGYTVNFIGGTKMDICEMDMADIRRVLKMAIIERAAINQTNMIHDLGLSPKAISDLFKENSPIEKDSI